MKLIVLDPTEVLQKMTEVPMNKTVKGTPRRSSTFGRDLFTPLPSCDRRKSPNLVEKEEEKPVSIFKTTMFGVRWRDTEH